MSISSFQSAQIPQTAATTCLCEFNNSYYC